MTMKGKGRKKGDWVKVAQSRGGSRREVASRSSRIGINFPNIGDVGSAAYRRLLARGTRRSSN